MDYTARYGLEFNPFVKNSREIPVETQETKEVRFRLEYLASTKGFGLLTGTPGLGKTTALRMFAASLSPSLYKVVYTGLSTLTVQEFYRHLASSLGAEPAFRKVDNFRTIQATVSRLAIEKRTTPVIILDEADHMGSAILDDLKILFNFEMDSRDRAVVLLAGHPRLAHTLSLNSHEALRQRIVMNYCMEGLTKDEGRSYVSAKLSGAGCRQAVFDDGALEAILNAANGIPRMINRLCDACLLISHTDGLNTVTADAAMKAINDIQII
ncbi:MAG: AAA family ATPase [Oscillospiraceae bacterium]|nr:AAA family ATPase [Oscillospiraceae bacterium]